MFRLKLLTQIRRPAVLGILAGASATTFQLSSFKDDHSTLASRFDIGDTSSSLTCRCERRAVVTQPQYEDLGYLTTVTAANPTSSDTTTAAGKLPLSPVEEKSGSGGSGASSFRLQDVYEIEEVLGEGAYGMVYRARRKSDGSTVALKTMSRSLTGKTDFEREVAALKLLSKPPGHDHIVQFYDLHRDDTNYYLAMELIEGGELLEHLIENGPYSEGLAASFLRQFAEAIYFVHNNGLAHADLKPENLLLSSNDMKKAKLKVADFGCAQSHDLSRKEMHLPYQEFAKGCSFLHMVALGNQFELEKLLQERPSLVNFRDYDFRTPLHLAASEGHVDICRFLVEKGARINRNDRFGGSPLDDAHRHRHPEVIKYLREHGATFGTLTQLPRFIQAASEGDQEEVKALLEFGNIDLDEGDYDRRTALHLAAGEGRIEVVELLCKSGADPNVEDRWGNRPLDDANGAKKNSKRIMKILIEYGGKSLKDPSLDRLPQDSDDTSYRSSTHTTRSLKRKKKCETASGTISYWPPELFADGAMPTPASDCWAVGAIMFVLLTGTHPFDKHANLTDEEIRDIIIEIGNCEKNKQIHLMNHFVFDERTEGLSDSCIELMRQLMHPDPQERLTSEKFLRHPWIQGLTASWTTMGKAHKELKAFWQSKFRAEIKKKFAKKIDSATYGDDDTNELSENVLVEIFHALDLKKNGVLELDEIQTVFRELGFSENNIKTIFAAADLDGTGVIHFDEFRALLTSKSNSTGSDDDNGGVVGGGRITDGEQGLQEDYLQQRFKSHILNRFMLTSAKNAEDGDGANPAHFDQNKLREIFNSIDLEGNGVLDPHDIRVVLRSAGEPEDVISRIVASLDLNQNGRVSWDDFN